MRKERNCRLSEPQAQKRLSELTSAGMISMNFKERIRLDLLIEELAELIEIERGVLIP